MHPLQFRLWRMSRSISTRLMPHLRYCQLIYEEILDQQVQRNTVWLDLGCGWRVLQPKKIEEEKLLVRRAGLVFGIDYDWDSLKKHKTLQGRIRGNITKLPFKDGSIDLVTSNMVAEHLEDPISAFREIHRVLNRGGRFLFHTPNTFGYPTVIGRLTPKFLRDPIIKLIDDREEADIFETYFRINNPQAIKRTAIQTGFKVENIRMVVSTPRIRIAPPLVVLELLATRVLLLDSLKNWRPNIIALLVKTE